MTKAQKRNEEYMAIRKALENLNYIILMGLIAGQVIVGENFLIGQCIYLIVDIISAWRCFALRRPVADKVKDVTFIVITALLICKGLFLG